MSANKFIGDVEEIISSEHPGSQRTRLIKEAYEKNNVPGEDGNSLLHLLVLPPSDSQPALAAAFSAGADLDALNKHQSTLLHLAAENGSGKMVKTLIGAGANFESANKDRKTPLYLAAEHGDLVAEHGDLVAVEELLVAGANVDSAAKYGTCLLEVAMTPAAQFRQPTEYSMKLLREVKLSQMRMGTLYCTCWRERTTEHRLWWGSLLREQKLMP